MKCIELPFNWLPVNQLIDQLTLHWVLFTATHWFQREHQDTVEYNFSGLDLERDVFIWFCFSHVSSGIRFVYWLQTHFLQPTAVLKNQYDYWCRCVEFETVSASCWLTPSHYSLCSTFFYCHGALWSVLLLFCVSTATAALSLSRTESECESCSLDHFCTS